MENFLFLRFSCVKIASLATSQVKHDTLKGILGFQICFQGQREGCCPSWFRNLYAEFTLNVPLLFLVHHNLSCSSLVPIKAFNLPKKISHGPNSPIIEIPSKLKISSMLCPNLSYIHLFIHYKVMHLRKDTLQAKVAQPFILPKWSLDAICYPDGRIDLQERPQDSDGLP